MHRRVDVRTAVLGRTEVVRRVVVALRRHAVGDLLELETFSCRPEDGLIAVIVREIDERAGRPAMVGGSRARRCDDGESDKKQSFHTADYCGSGKLSGSVRLS